MALFDVFTGNPSKRAGEAARGYLGGERDRITGVLGGARDTGLAALQSGSAGGLESLLSGFGGARADIAGGQDPRLQALIEGYGGGERALGQSQTDALATLNEGTAAASRAYDPLAAAAGRYGDLGSEASSMVAKALGLRGAEGAKEAIGAFQTGPGYDWEQNEAARGASRGAAAAGMAAGGNMFADLAKQSQGIANQAYYKNWLPAVTGQGQFFSNLERGAKGDVATGRANAALTGGTGGANIITGTGRAISDLYGASGRDKAGVYGDVATRLADLNSRMGTGAAGIQTGTGGQVADFLRGLGGTEANAITQLAGPAAKTYQDAAAAEEGGSRNLWNLIGSAATGAGGMGWFNSIPGLGGLQSYVMAGRGGQRAGG